MSIVHAVEQHDSEDVSPSGATTDLPPAVDIPRAKSPEDVAHDNLKLTEQRASRGKSDEKSQQHLADISSSRPSLSLKPGAERLSQSSTSREARSQSLNLDTSRERESSADTVKPVVKRPSDAAAYAEAAEVIPSDQDQSLLKSQEQTTTHRKQKRSDDSTSSDNIWHSSPTSRISSNDLGSGRPNISRSGSSTSFRTANEDLSPSTPRLASVPEIDSHSASSADNHTLQKHISSSPSGVRTITPPSPDQSSGVSLIRHEQHDGPADTSNAKSTTVHSVDAHDGPVATPIVGKKTPAEPPQKDSHTAHSGLVRFEIPADEEQQRRMMKVRLAQMRKRDAFKRIRHGIVRQGQVVKIEKMLVRVEFTRHNVPEDLTENESEKIETSVVERWKEFMCVCREYDDDECPFVLQLYKSRVIPAIEKEHVKKRWTHQIELRRSDCHINLYSSLDKTMAVWHPCKRGTLLFTLQSRSAANSMEWYTFLRNILGWSRASVLQIEVPDLAVNLRIDKPFQTIESVREVAQAASGDEQAMIRTMKEEQAATARIIERCVEMLKESPDWEQVLSHWMGIQRMGLAWKRYDRLEWVHGANEKKMYGTIAMEKTHGLELRPKQHYPTAVRDQKHQNITEPPPIEGFLIRLTSQKGADKKLGKMFFKRLYFSTHNQFLVFNRPAHADPPPPPQLPMTNSEQIPTAEEIAQKTPLVYAIAPYALKDHEIEWLSGPRDEAPQQLTKHDKDALDENQRRVGLLRNCDGLINLCNVVKVRRLKRGATPADDHIDIGTDVDFDAEVPNTVQDDGTTRDMDDSRTFELVLRNGLIVRLQAFDETTRQEWMARLRDLVKYWKLRTAADISLFKAVRAQNLTRLKIDEQTESQVGQFAQKWEVSDSFASSELYNMCGISCCRSIHIAGQLFHKPRLRGVFKQMLCVLSYGKLLMFADTLRGSSGKILKHIHHERIGTLDLRECYIYSGLTAASDLVHSAADIQSDRARPGRHGLPRIWQEDGWTATDEDSSTCFVIWHGKKSGWFRSQDDPSRAEQKEGRSDSTTGGLTRRISNRADEQREKGRQRLRRVRKLGTEGKSIVFRARSRAERDHWVLSIAMEIERLQTGEDIRIVDDSDDEG